MLSTQLRILRVFGLSSAEVASVLRTARAEGCPGLRLLERDGEFAVCIQVSAPTRAMAEDYCEKWAQKLRARFGDAVYGTGEISLAQATLDALVKKRRLIVAADEPTGRLVGALLRPLEHSEAVFDYGTQTYANPENARKIVTPENLLQKFPGDVLQAAAGRAQLALAVGNADYAVVYMPATVGQAPFVLLCDKRSAVACAVSPELSDAAIANNILDLARRRALGLRFSGSTITFRPGHERPLLIVSQEGQTKGDTTRFSLRRRAPKTADSSFEPMMDFDTPLPQQQPAPTRRTLRTPASSTDTAPLGTITFEQAPASTPAPEQEPLPDPMEITTAGPEAAAASRAARGVAAPEPEAPSSILDGEIPDFSAGLDPEAIAAAQAADDAQPPKSAEEFQRAASRLFADDEDDEPDPPEKKRRSSRTKHAKTAPSAPTAAASIKNRSLAMIEKTERRRRRATILGMLFLVLLVAGVAVGIFLFLRSDLGSKPSVRTYGTAAYDESATAYLDNALQKLDGVGGYLGFSGQDGFFVYGQDAEPKEEAAARMPGTSYLGSAQPSNTVLDCGGSRLAGLADLETFRQNSGFTLYLPGATYRYKVVAVYYADPADSANPFDPAAFTDLSNYYDYLDFVLGAQIRSLYTTGVEVGTGASFLTLVSDGETPGTRLWVTGRLIAEGEDAKLDTSAIGAAENPLLPAALAQGQTDAAALLAQALADFTAQPAQAAPAQQASAQEEAVEEPTFDADALAAEAHALAQSTSELLAGLTDVAGDANAVETQITKGAEGELPEQTVSLESVVATPAPTQAPTPTAAPAQSAAPTPTPQEESRGGLNVDGAGQTGPEPPGRSGETINVTMNGTAQTMDLVQCLAMIAQNELGDGAPAEAYKAQCVAAHCWILSQGGYPSVAGTSPSAAATAAAQEVAHVLITYNGSVCFTPYFASASTGTASAADVWGTDRPWLQAVDSPYDQSVATNWNTNGNNTGCARFSRQTLQDRILAELGIDLSGVDPNNWFKILSANQYGWVAQMQIGPDEGPNTTCSGRWFRENLTAGQSVDGRSLRSQCFTFTYDAGLDCFIFDVYGYGHGCGMSQWGAVGYAQNGWDYASILTHYYPGTTLTSY